MPEVDTERFGLVGDTETRTIYGQRTANDGSIAGAMLHPRNIQRAGQYDEKVASTSLVHGPRGGFTKEHDEAGVDLVYLRRLAVIVYKVAHCAVICYTPRWSVATDTRARCSLIDCSVMQCVCWL